jgi:hypothetical protein
VDAKRIRGLWIARAAVAVWNWAGHVDTIRGRLGVIVAVFAVVVGGLLLLLKALGLIDTVLAIVGAAAVIGGILFLSAFVSHLQAASSTAEGSESTRDDTKKIVRETIREDEQSKRKLLDTIQAAVDKQTKVPAPKSPPPLPVKVADPDRLQRLLDEGVALLRDYQTFGIAGLHGTPHDAQAWAARVEYEIQANPRALAEFRYKRRSPFGLAAITGAPLGGLSRDDLEQKVASLSRIIRNRNSGWS